MTDRSLRELIVDGEIGPIDAVTVTYIPEWLCDRSGAGDDADVRAWFDDQHRFSAILSTHLGRTAIATIPWFVSELYTRCDDLLEHVVAVLADARRMGARVASLAGLIPSATGYGSAIANGLPPGGNYPEITTGHETTAASVALAVERLLGDAERSLKDECVAFLGLGSIGMASLRVMMDVLPHPRRLVLCDVYGHEDKLEAAAERVQGEAGFEGTVNLVCAEGGLPAEFYDATLVVGATNVPDVVDVDRLQPGCLIVDDSAPHCFSVRKALDRVARSGDMLVNEGGILQTPYPMHHVRHVPPASTRAVPPEKFAQMSTRHPQRITSCVLAALLGAAFADSPRSIGAVRLEDSVGQFKRLKQLGYVAAPPHIERDDLPPSLVRSFAERYGVTRLRT